MMRRIFGSAKNPSWGKLGLNWEGPYRITSVAGIGAYYLEDLDECRGLFCMIWYVGLPPAVMGWAASYGDGP